MPLNVFGKYNTSLRLFSVPSRGFLPCRYVSRDSHTIPGTNIITLSRKNPKTEVHADPMFSVHGEVLLFILSTTKKDPLNVLSHVEQKVSEKAEKQRCKKDIT